MSRPLFDQMNDVGNRIADAPHVLLGLDFDGVLAPLEEEPAAIQVSVHMQRALAELSQREDVTIAILSGRERADLQMRVGVPNLIYVGNHGLDISGPGCLFVEPTAASRTNIIQDLAEVLTRRLDHVPGVTVRNNGLSICVQEGPMDPMYRMQVRRVVHGVIACLRRFFILHAGDHIYEIRPRVYWNKGAAVSWIMDNLHLSHALPIYVGSDIMDDEAFPLLSEGIRIQVSETPCPEADYVLAGPAEVRKFLEWVSCLKKEKTADVF